MNLQLKKELGHLIKIFNCVARLSCYDNSSSVINMLDASYEKLEPYRKYWVETDFKIGKIVLRK